MAKHSVRTRVVAAILCVVFLVSIFLGIAQIGVEINQAWRRWMPDYEKKDITAILKKPELTDEDYQILYEQTGLAKAGVDGLIKRGQTTKIVDIQTMFFEDRKVNLLHIAPFTYQEVCDTFMLHAALEDGDIILTASVYVSYFRYGHSALVVDGEKGELLESLEPGSFSKVTYKNNMFLFSTFLIVRPKVEEEVRKQVAKFAAENLINIPYRLTTGILSKKFQEPLKGTQCTHIVWWAYKKFGVELDGNGGSVVKPQDIFLSDKVEVVQAYGYPLDTLWGET